MPRAVLLGIFLALVLVPVTLAEVDLSLSTKLLSIRTGESEQVMLLIQNQQETADRFAITVWPTYLAGIGTRLEREYITIDARSSASIRLWFDVTYEAEEVSSIFRISVESLANPNISDSEDLMVFVKRKAPYFISDLRLDRYVVDPGQILNIEITLTNLAMEASPILELATFLKKDGQILHRWDDRVSIERQASKLVTHAYSFDKHARARTYFVEVELRELTTLIDVESISLSVSEVPFTYEYKEKVVERHPFWIRTSIRFLNEGNVQSESFLVTESLPLFVDLFFDPEIEPELKNVTALRVIYTWRVKPLQPGEEFEIRYSFVLWPLWMMMGIASALAFIIYQSIYTLRITKLPRYTGPITYEREIPIILDVTNKTSRELKNVVVHDFVPPLARVVKAFDTFPPRIKETKEGTRILWKVGTLRPHEERILTYKIRPIVEVIGTLKLPKAYMYYTDRKKRKRAVTSKSIAIKPG